MYHRLMVELRNEDRAGFRNFLRVQPELFDEILQRVGHIIQGVGCNFRGPLEPGLKVAVTLRFLATGESYMSLSYAFRVSEPSISKFLPKVCDAIVDIIGAETLHFPTTTQEWLDIARIFEERWNFPHSLGALDGKHVAIRCPRNGGSLYFNYKKFHSIIMMAMVDGDYKFIWADIGSNGACSDAQVFIDCDLRRGLEHNTLAIPAAAPLPGRNGDVPYFLIGDDAFPLRTWMMKPYSARNLTREERIFNYRLSRARRIVENAFGILAQRWGCLLTTMRQEPPVVISVCLACVTLHNMIRRRYPQME